MRALIVSFALVGLITSVLSSSVFASSSDLIGGKGNPAINRFPKDRSDNDIFLPNQAYLSIYAVSWYVNDQDSFWFNKSVAGTLEVDIGRCRYPIVLGQFDLSGGQKVGGVFDKPVLPMVPYDGSDITIATLFQGHKTDTALGLVLKGAAEASLSVVSTAATATSAGVANALLGAVAGKLVTGAQNALQKTDKNQPLYNSQDTIRTLELRGKETYYLFRRGTDGLDDSKFSVKEGTFELDYAGKPFKDGAWLLIDVVRSTAYLGGSRPWTTDWKLGLANLENLCDGWKDGSVTLEKVKSELTPAINSNKQSVGDAIRTVRASIANDLGLIEKDRQHLMNELTAKLLLANKAVLTNTPTLWCPDEGPAQAADRDFEPFPLR